jgi:class 3 adenylate cyclase
MPDLTHLIIGSARRMNAAILFFDLQDFTSTTSRLSNEQTLYILNLIIRGTTKIVRHWGGTIEKNTGDGIMAIVGTETRFEEVIAREAIECAMAIQYVMLKNINPILESNNLPVMGFRMGIDMEEVLISRLGIPRNNFITVIGDAANRASALKSLAVKNGICIGENLANSLHPYLNRYLHEGTNPGWKWVKEPTNRPYRFFHYRCRFPEPRVWARFNFNREDVGF